MAGMQVLSRHSAKFFHNLPTQSPSYELMPQRMLLGWGAVSEIRRCFASIGDKLYFRAKERTTTISRSRKHLREQSSIP